MNAKEFFAKYGRSRIDLGNNQSISISELYAVFKMRLEDEAAAEREAAVVEHEAIMRDIMGPAGQG